MKNKKGFTLIELLAVIVILAIIALIATPIILNMINDARKNSAKSSALGYIDAIEYNNGFAQLGTADINGTYEEIKSGDVSTANQKLGSHLKGKAPTSGTVTIDSKGKVTAADFCINGYNVTYDGKDATVNGKCNGSNNSNNEPEPVVYNPGDIVYFDPVINDKCTTFSVDAIKNGTSTCYKWSVITVGDTSSALKVTLQLDHNLGNKLSWINESDYANYSNTGWTGNGNITKGPVTALKALSSATANWDDSLLLNYTYDTSSAVVNYGTLTCVDGTCKNGSGDTIATNVKARMITGEEVKALTLYAGATEDSVAGTWSLTNTKNFIVSNYDMILGSLCSGARVNGGGSKNLSWLLENTQSSSIDDTGATSDVYGIETNAGYWSLSIDAYNAPPDEAFPYYTGSCYGTAPATTSYAFGVRPVITIEKSKLQ